MNVNDRLKVVCENKKIKNIDLVSLGCGSQQTVSFVLNGKVKPNSQFLEVFLKEFKNVNARWLLTGEEEMVEEPRAQYGFCKECIKKDGRIEQLEKQCAAKDKRIEELLIKGSQTPGGAPRQSNEQKKAS
jgi:hypothetical protein